MIVGKVFFNKETGVVKSTEVVVGDIEADIGDVVELYTDSDDPVAYLVVDMEKVGKINKNTAKVINGKIEVGETTRLEGGV